MLALQITLIVLGVILVVAVLMQHGKSYGLSGTIAGGAETFFGKENGSKIDKILARATSVIGALFMVLSLAAFILQENAPTPSSKNLGFIDLFANTEHTHGDESGEAGESTDSSENKDDTGDNAADK